MKSNSVDIAKLFTNGGKVSTSEARRLASAYLQALDTIAGLQQTVDKLIDGPIEQSETISHNWQVWQAINKQKVIFAGGNHIINTVNRLIHDVCNVTTNRSLGRTLITGSKKKTELFLLLNEAVSIAIQEAYNQGFDDGNSFLHRIVTGDISIKELDATVK